MILYNTLIKHPEFTTYILRFRPFQNYIETVYRRKSEIDERDVVFYNFLPLKFREKILKIVIDRIGSEDQVRISKRAKILLASSLKDVSIDLIHEFCMKIPEVTPIIVRRGIYNDLRAIGIGKEQYRTILASNIFRDLTYKEQRSIIDDYLSLPNPDEYDMFIRKYFESESLDNLITTNKLIDLFRLINAKVETELLEVFSRIKYPILIDISDPRNLHNVIELAKLIDNIDLLNHILQHVQSYIQLNLVLDIVKIAKNRYSKGTYNKEFFEIIFYDLNQSYELIKTNPNISVDLMKVALDVSNTIGIIIKTDVKSREDIYNYVSGVIGGPYQHIDMIFANLRRFQESHVAKSISNYLKDYKAAQDKLNFRYNSKYVDPGKNLHRQLSDPGAWIGNVSTDWEFHWDLLMQKIQETINPDDTRNFPESTDPRQLDKYKESISALNRILESRDTSSIDELKNVLQNLLNVYISVFRDKKHIYTSSIGWIMNNIDGFWIKIEEIDDIEKILDMHSLLHMSNSCLRYDGNSKNKLDLFGLATDPNSKILLIRTKKHDKAVSRVIFRLAQDLEGSLVLTRNSRYYHSGYELNEHIDFENIGDKYLRKRAEELGIKFIGPNRHSRINIIPGNTFDRTYVE
ncbi:MAG: hypothetical protein NZ908_00750 [Candidatus Micrarchaeota archaeon]|nr:hypothetical protein [Candidatus Micrarchaeota archaeon]